MLTPTEVTKALKTITRLKDQRAAALAEIDGIIAILRSGDTDGRCLASWVEIGDALGVSKQTVQTRYRSLSWSSVDSDEQRGYDEDAGIGR